MSADLIFVSAEPSGDELAADVINHIRKSAGPLTIAAIGGDGLQKAGLISPFDISALSIVGFADALKIYGKAIKLADDITDYIIEQNPRAVVLVDSWGFTIRLAERLRRRAPHIKRIKLLGPQVWATRAGRAKTLAQNVDHLLCMHDFEVPFYEPFGLPCTVIGIPALSRMERGNGAAFRESHKISTSSKLMLILPGSRSSEIRRVAPVLAEAACLTKDQLGEKLEVCVLVSPGIAKPLEDAALHWPEGTRFIRDPSEKADLMAASDLALACSGTVTTELATQGCPMVVGYKLGWITYFLAKFFLFKASYFTLVNVAADAEIVPELLQTEFSAERTSDLAIKLLDNEANRRTQIEQVREAVRKMGWGKTPAHVVAAEKITELTA